MDVPFSYCQSLLLSGVYRSFLSELAANSLIERFHGSYLLFAFGKFLNPVTFEGYCQPPFEDLSG